MKSKNTPLNCIQCLTVLLSSRPWSWSRVVSRPNLPVLVLVLNLPILVLVLKAVVLVLKGLVLITTLVFKVENQDVAELCWYL